MWTENVTWFSNEEGKKGRIEVGQLADLIVPDRDFFSCAESEIADITSDLTVVGGRIVYGSGAFKALDASAPPPAMPDWSPVRTFGGYGNWVGSDGEAQAVRAYATQMCGCANACCGVHGHDHARAWSGKLPVSDLRSFWGALGCACWAVWMAAMIDTPRWISATLSTPGLLPIARVALVSAFLIGGIQKLADFPAAIAEQAHFGLQPAGLWAVAAIVVELGGSILVIVGRWVWLGAGGLGVLTAVSMLVANNFWAQTGHDRFMATNAFFEHLGLVAGLVLITAFSPHERQRGHHA